MKKKIVVTDSNLGDSSLERAVLEPDFDVARYDVLTEDEVIEVARDADGILVQWAPITERVMAALPDLSAVVRYGIGMDNIDVDAVKRRGVAISNVDDYCLAEVADHAVAAIYAHNRRLVVGSRIIDESGWGTAGITAPLRPGSDPVGIAGFGRIGREVAARANALGFEIHVWDPFVTDPGAGVVAHPTLVELAAAVNHLSLHIPSNAATKHIVGAEVIAALGPAGHLVNTARGALVDEQALLSALNAGELGFASLDVFSAEPPTGLAAELAAHPRVLTTPHIAYLSTDSLPALQIRAAQIMAGLLSGTAGR